MTENRWFTPVLILVLLIVFGFITIIAPRVIGNLTSGGGIALGSGGGAASEVVIPDASSGPESVVIQPEGYLLGEELVKIPAVGDYNRLDPSERSFTSLQLFGILTAIVIGGLAFFTVPIFLLVWLGDRSRTAQGSDEAYTNGLKALKSKQDEYVKEQKTINPPTVKPEHHRPAIQAWVAGILTILMAYGFGYVIGEGVSVGLGTGFARGFAIVAIVGSWLYFRPTRIVEIEQSDMNVVDTEARSRATWVLLSGALVMGLGLGLTFIVVSGGDPFPFIEWNVLNPDGTRSFVQVDWQYFVDLTEPIHLSNWQ